ncbi:hypothetical protein HDU96_009640 [Phlyctochytrium bullatum]|nr:hypothetical protein HDU96_009640 [Phlyctochytrium bullatum]
MASLHARPLLLRIAARPSTLLAPPAGRCRHLSSQGPQNPSQTPPPAAATPNPTPLPGTDGASATPTPSFSPSLTFTSELSAARTAADAVTPPSFLRATIPRPSLARTRSPTVPAQPSFDTRRFADQLKGEGFNEAQAEAILALVAEAVGESMVRREELDAFLHESHTDFTSLRRDIHSLERGDFAVLRSELQRIGGEVGRIQETMLEDVGRAHGGTRLDVNLEKARILDEAGQLEELVARAEERIEKEVGVLERRLERMREEMRAGLRNFVVGLVVFVGAYKVYQLSH